jgi:hypothetical protein
MADGPKRPNSPTAKGFEAGPTKLDSPRARVAATTEEEKTAVFDEPGLPRRGSAAERQRGVDDEPGLPRRGSAGQRGVDDSGNYPSTPRASIPKPGEPDFVREASTPLRVKSMKTPGQVSSGEIPLPPDVVRPQHQVKLRAISEVASKTPQLALGYLAPPRDPKEVRSRRRGELVMWGSVAVIIACVIALGIWFLAK